MSLFYFELIRHVFRLQRYIDVDEREIILRKLKDSGDDGMARNLIMGSLSLHHCQYRWNVGGERCNG